jgi:hypothetical protein
MIDDGSTFKLMVHGLVIFVSMAITIANEILTRIGLAGNSIYVFALALLVVSMLLGRHMIMQGVILGAVLLLTAPDATLDFYNLNRDFLLSAICAGILVPTLFSLLNSPRTS